MTTETFKKIPPSTRFKEEAKDSGRGVRSVQYFDYTKSLEVDAKEGYHELGCLEEYDYNAQIEEYVADGAVAKVDLGVRKNAHKKEMSFTVSYPEEKAIALAKGLGDPTPNYPGTPNDTLVVSSTETTVTVTALDGANYSQGDLIEIVVGDSTNGTASIFRRIKSISTDTFTLNRPFGEQPEVGAAVKEVESIDYIETNEDFPDPIGLRFTENHDGRSNMTFEQILKFQPTYGTVTPGNGLDAYMVTVTGKALGDYDVTNDRYIISKRRTLALNP